MSRRTEKYSSAEQRTESALNCHKPLVELQSVHLFQHFLLREGSVNSILQYPLRDRKVFNFILKVGNCIGRTSGFVIMVAMAHHNGEGDSQREYGRGNKDSLDFFK